VSPVYLLDANVLIALTNPDHLHHRRAHEWFAAVDAWATTPMTEAAFVRLMLNPQVAGRRLTAGEVLDVLRRLRALPGHRFVADDTSLAEPAIDLVALIGHRQVTDLHLVNLAARGGLVVATFDAGLPATLTGRDGELVRLVQADR